MLIEAAHRLNEDAQNILLKTLEEPPAGLVIMLQPTRTTCCCRRSVRAHARIRLGPVPAREIEALLVETAGVDPGRRPGSLGSPAGDRASRWPTHASGDAFDVRAELSRSLLDLVRKGRAARLAASGTDAASAELLAALAPPVAAEDEPRPARGRRVRAAPAPVSTGAAATRNRHDVRPRPGRRTATSRQPLLAVWREVMTDVVRTQLGDPGAVHEPDLIDEFGAAARAVPHEAVVGFLRRIDAALERLDANANPELVLDVVALAVPRSAAAA